MKLYLSIDMEGITGLPDYTYVDYRAHNYEQARKIMTKEVNYCLQAAYDFGCTEILVNDSHSKMNNLLINELHSEAKLITGGAKPLSMVEGLDNTFDGAMFIGYHSRAGQPGVMSHTMVGAVRNFYINDKPVGELGLNAYVAGYFGVPLLLVSGDNYTTKEAKDLIPNITTVPVKEAISRSAARSLTPKKAGELLSEKVLYALDNQQMVQPLTPPKNPQLKIEFANYGQAEWANLMPGTQIIPNTTTVLYQAKDIVETYQAMLVMIDLAENTTF